MTTLGILAGGAATRLSGRDKAWLERDGIPQVLRLRRRFQGRVDAFIVSANAGAERYRAHGITVVPDGVRGAGPMAGLSALAGACTTPWLLTLPVDLVDCNDCLLPTLRSMAGDAGAWAEDDEGPQPLVALWRVATLRDAARRALRDGAYSVRDLQARYGMRGVRLAGVRFGNLNTPADLARAGVA
ncbi:MAG TPA: NTP transferase domain-containing protein [Xanthomonadaceae bacterium]|nr:NTP transferase domain-containing protein [Xanthomonadaceae bacterium]